MVTDYFGLEEETNESDPVRISPRTGKPMRHRRTKEEIAAERGDTEPDSISPRAGKMRGELKALVGAFNEVLRNLPPTKDDALTEEEAINLIEALDRAQQSSVRLRKLLKRATTGSGILGLVVVGLLIALPRLQRHGLIPGSRREPTNAEKMAAEWYRQRGLQPTTQAEWDATVKQAEEQLSAVGA